MLIDNTVYIHDHGHVRLDDSMADDLSVVNSAKVSFANRSAELGDSERGLIGYLMRERHGTPFEHNSFRFNVRCPIKIGREFLRHRIASFNEESTRYSRARLDCYVPQVSYMRTQVGKPGAYKFEFVGDLIAIQAQEMMMEQYDSACDTYERLLRLGIAKEVASFVLPLGMFTEFYLTMNARSLMNFLSLRAETNAQREMQDYAVVMESFFAEKMPTTYEHFIRNGRVAP